MRPTLRPEKRAEYEAELARPPIPGGAAYLWQTYLRIRRRKAGNGLGASPIEWPDIDAFVRNSRFPLTPWEIETIEHIDDLFLAAQAGQNNQGEAQHDGR